MSRYDRIELQRRHKPRGRYGKTTSSRAWRGASGCIIRHHDTEVDYRCGAQVGTAGHGIEMRHGRKGVIEHYLSVVRAVLMILTCGTRAQTLMREAEHEADARTRKGQAKWSYNCSNKYIQRDVIVVFIA